MFSGDTQIQKDYILRGKTLRFMADRMQRRRIGQVFTYDSHEGYDVYEYMIQEISPLLHALSGLDTLRCLTALKVVVVHFSQHQRQTHQWPVTDALPVTI